MFVATCMLLWWWGTSDTETATAAAAATGMAGAAVVLEQAVLNPTKHIGIYILTKIAGDKDQHTYHKTKNEYPAAKKTFFLIFFSDIVEKLVGF